VGTTANMDAEPVTQEELDAQSPEALPQRDMMSLIDPGATTGTPAAELLPAEATQWHGPPHEPHIM
jgi:precorrin-6B methylase 2